jgi:N-acetylglutamate synthase-like GNAT family acetyltransferase
MRQTNHRFVESARWRQDIGRSFVQWCVSVARSQGFKALHVTGNPHATSFYVACGFQQIGTTETRFGPGLLLRKDLWAVT